MVVCNIDYLVKSCLGSWEDIREYFPGERGRRSQDREKHSKGGGIVLIPMRTPGNSTIISTIIHPFSLHLEQCSICPANVNEKAIPY